MFPDLTPGSHLLSIHARDHVFPAYRVDVSDAETSNPETPRVQLHQTFRGNEWGNKGPRIGASEAGGDGSLSVSVAPSGRKEFYRQREGFNILSFLKNPMILMALVMGAMVFGFPYMLGSSTYHDIMWFLRRRVWRELDGVSLQCADERQWTKKRVPNSTRCQRRARWLVRRARRRRFRTSISRLSLRVGSRAVRMEDGRLLEVQRRDDDNEYTIFLKPTALLHGSVHGVIQGCYSQASISTWEHTLQSDQLFSRWATTMSIISQADIEHCSLCDSGHAGSEHSCLQSQK